MIAWHRFVPLAAALVIAGCAGDRSRSPVCGISLMAGPTLIQQQLNNARALLTEPPRGLPATLPARVAGHSEQGRVDVGAARDQLVLGYEGAGFPAPGPGGYGLLVVDDTSQRVVGVMIYESVRPPDSYPKLGTLTGGTTVLPLYGVRLSWADVSNPRCPLLGDTAAAGR